MGIDEWAVIAFGAALGGLLAWGFGRLPGERWQFLAAFPLRKDGNGAWQAANLTFYGVLNALAYTLSCLVAVVLLGAAGLTFGATAALMGAVLLVCVPGSRLIARWVEKKKHTFSIGGASFLGIVLLPWIVHGMGLAWPARWADVAPLPVLAAVCIAYSLGEGVGRLACLSFGCCYGKPMTEAPRWLRRCLGRRGTRFSGATKKIAYAGALEGVPVVPVQAMTCLLYCAIGLAGAYLFLQAAYRTAFLVCLAGTQLWRFASEFLRSDHRGGGRISAYQLMSLAAVAYGLAAAAFLDAGGPAATPDLAAGLGALWTPGAILCLEAVWVATFLYTGISEVTGATLTFHVRRQRI